MGPTFGKSNTQKRRNKANRHEIHDSNDDEYESDGDPSGARVMKENEEEENSSLIYSNALLIVAPKGQIEVWAEEIRSLTQPRLCVYTATLGKRRKIGAHSLAQYDVVITTFDVRTVRVKAPRCAVSSNMSC
jgi:SNF2-related domain